MDRPELREIRKDEFKRHHRYSLLHTSTDVSPDSLRYLDSFDTYGLYRDERLLMVFAVSLQRGHLRGEPTDIAIFAHGYIPPENRQTGIINMAVPRIFELADRLGASCILLNEFSPGIYEQFGMAIIENQSEWSVPPDALKAAAKSANGEFRRLSMDDVAELSAVHDAYSERFAVGIDRSPEYWEWVLRDPSGTPYHMAGLERDGELRAYAVYKLFTDGTLIEVDMAYEDLMAHQQMLHYFGRHGSQIETVKFDSSGDSHVFSLIDQEDAECRVDPGTVMRVIDVTETLEATGAPSQYSGELVLKIDDYIRSENDDTFRISARDGTIECSETDVAPEISLKINALPQLISGYRRPSVLEELGSITVHDDGAVDELSKMFPPATSFIRDRF